MLPNFYAQRQENAKTRNNGHACSYPSEICGNNLYITGEICIPRWFGDEVIPDHNVKKSTMSAKSLDELKKFFRKIKFLIFMYRHVFIFSFINHESVPLNYVDFLLFYVKTQYTNGVKVLWDDRCSDLAIIFWKAKTGKERAGERRRYRRPSLTIGVITAVETITSLRWVTEIVNFWSAKNVANSVIVFSFTFDPFQKRSI